MPYSWLNQGGTSQPNYDQFRQMMASLMGQLNPGQVAEAGSVDIANPPDYAPNFPIAGGGGGADGPSVEINPGAGSGSPAPSSPSSPWNGGSSPSSPGGYTSYAPPGGYPAPGAGASGGSSGFGGLLGHLGSGLGNAWLTYTPIGRLIASLSHLVGGTLGQHGGPGWNPPIAQLVRGIGDLLNPPETWQHNAAANTTGSSFPTYGGGVSPIAGETSLAGGGQALGIDPNTGAPVYQPLGSGHFGHNLSQARQNYSGTGVSGGPGGGDWLSISPAMLAYMGLAGPGSAARPGHGFTGPLIL